MIINMIPQKKDWTYIRGGPTGPVINARGISGLVQHLFYLVVEA
jgi:hypothetical protein